ncbi:MAG: zinc-dependent peptidase, partial [Segetibacter sp.]
MPPNIQRIREAQSDINPYGSAHQAEFFAVVSEYFFQRPDLLQENHPELFELLTQIFRQQLAKQ